MSFGLRIPLFWDALLAGLLLTLGCTSYPNRPVVSEVVLEEQGEGAEGADTEQALEGLAIGSSSGFLFLWREYDVYDATVLAKDLERIERYYRARGYYEAKVNAARVIRVDEHKVRIQIRVDPGEMTTIRSIVPRGLALLPLEVSSAATRALKLRVGQRFDETVFGDTKRALEEAVGNGGYAFAKVHAKAKVDLSKHAADLEFTIDPGPLARYGEVRITGLQEIPERPVRAAFDIKKGGRYSRAELVDAERALQELNVFASVDIREDRSKPESGVVPIQVVVRESKLRTLKLGGGVRFDVLRLTTHLRTGWEHKNFLGDMRRLSIDTKPGLTWYPIRLASFDEWDGLTRILFEDYTRIELRQPSFLEARTAGLLAAEYNVYPLLYPLPEGVNPEDETIIGYHEIRAQTGLTRKFFEHHLEGTLTYNWQANFPFAYQNENELGPVRVSFPELFLALDFRDDPIEPRRGFYLSNSVQVAGYIFQGTVSDVRLRPEARGYLPLFKQVTLSGRLTFGFLFPADYGETLNPRTSEGVQAVVDPTDVDVIRDQQKLLLRAFYSGGPSSNRGYPFRAVGPHGPVGFLIPTGLNCSLAGRSVEDLPEGCIRPLGGFTLWEASVEVRWTFARPLGAVVFLDASDLTRQVGQIRLNVPHLSVGPGLRYMTPVGPLRFDVGYRIPGAQAIGQDELPPEEGRPGGEFFDVLPITLQLAIGEAF